MVIPGYTAENHLSLAFPYWELKMLSAFLYPTRPVGR